MTDTMEVKPDETDEGPKKAEVRFESSLPIEEAVSYFEAIVTGLKKGVLHLKQGDESLTLNPAPHVDVEVRATRKKGKERIAFELNWRTGQSSDLAITSE